MRLRDLLHFIAMHGCAAWIVGDVIVIESHGKTRSFITTYYDAVRTYAEARTVLGY